MRCRRHRPRAKTAGEPPAEGLLAAATVPLRRLEEVVANAQALELQLSAAQKVDELLAQQLAEVSPDRRAAEAAMPQAQSAYMAAVQRVREAAAEREIAVAEVAVIAAEEIAAELTAALNAALTIEAKLHSLRGALLARTGDGGSHAGLAAEKTTAVIQGAKRAAGVKHDLESGPRLLEALAGDPTARL
jgi:hypothetical protein